jgi:hypothetical protein
VGKYGTNLEGFGGFEGGVNADKGAPLVSTSSDGETALLFGPAALREIQAGVANGDFAIPPDEATATITSENPLPYWTFTDDSSAGAITCAIVADTGSASSNVLRWTVAAGTTTGKTASISRYISVPATRDKAYAFWPEIYVKNDVASRVAQRQVTIRLEYFTADFTSVSTAITHSYTFSTFTAQALVFENGDGASKLIAPATAAFGKFTIQVTTTGTTATAVSLDVCEVKFLPAPPILLAADREGVRPPAAIWKNTALYLSATVPTTESGGLLATTNPYVSVGLTSITHKAPTVIVDGDLQVNEYLNFAGSTLSQYDRAGSADTTTITTAGTYYALTNAEASFTPQFVGQRWLLIYTGYASLNTTTIQYAFVRADVTDASNAQIAVLGYGRADNFGQSGRGATVAVSKVWVADNTSARKFKLYGTVQTTNGLILSLAYTQMTAYPIG